MPPLGLRDAKVDPSRGLAGRHGGNQNGCDATVGRTGLCRSRRYSCAVEQNRIDLDRSENGVAVVVLTGEHDLYTAPALRDRIGAVLDEGGPFIIDLTPATFIDSSVLRVLLEARRQADEKGVGFAVALAEGETSGVRRVLEVTGLIPVFPVFPARKDALQAATSSDGQT